MPQVHTFYVPDSTHEKITEAKKLIEATHGENDSNAELMRLGALVVIGDYDVGQSEAEAEATTTAAPAKKTAKK